MDKIIKIQSLEGGGFDAIKRLCNFDIPSGSVYDFSSSYVNLVATATTTDDGANGGQGVYTLKTTTDGNENAIPNVAFVKNAELRCQQHGQICNTRKVDTLQTTLKVLRNTTSELEAEEYYNASNSVSKKKTRNTPFRELVRLGTQKSRNVDAHLKIPLKDIFDYCDFPEYDSNRHGATRLHLELQVDKLAVLLSTDDDQMKDNDRNKLLKLGATQSFTDANGITEAIVDFPFDELSESPYFTGMKVHLTGSVGGGGTDIDDDVMITAISKITDVNDNNYGKLKLTFDSAVGAVVANNGKALTNFVVANVKNITAPSTLTTSFNSAELVLRVVGQPQGLDNKPRPYQTYTSEEYNANGSRNHQYAVQIEPNTSGIYMMYPNDIVSKNGDIDDGGAKIRLRHNDKELTNRDIQLDTPLHYERLVMTMANSGYKLHNLSLTYPSGKEDVSRQNAIDNIANLLKIAVYATPLPPMNEYSQLQINHSDVGAGGIQRVIVYREVQKSI